MKRTAIFTLTALMILSLTAFAQPGQLCGQGRMGSGPGFGNHPGHGQGHGMKQGMRDGTPGIQMLLRNADELQLTENQQGKLEAMMVDFQKAQVDRKAELQKANIDLKALMADENASESAVGAAIDKVSGLRAEMQKTRYAHHKQVQSVLTDDQKEKIETLRKERRQMRQDNRSGRGGGQMRKGQNNGPGM